MNTTKQKIQTDPFFFDLQFDRCRRHCGCPRVAPPRGGAAPPDRTGKSGQRGAYPSLLQRLDALLIVEGRPVVLVEQHTAVGVQDGLPDGGRQLVPLRDEFFWRFWN